MLEAMHGTSGRAFSGQEVAPAGVEPEAAPSVSIRGLENEECKPGQGIPFVPFELAASKASRAGLDVSDSSSAALDRRPPEPAEEK